MDCGLARRSSAVEGWKNHVFATPHVYTAAHGSLNLLREILTRDHLGYLLGNVPVVFRSRSVAFGG